MDQHILNWKYSDKHKYVLYAGLILMIAVFMLVFPSDQYAPVFYALLGGLILTVVLGAVILFMDYQRRNKPSREFEEVWGTLKKVFDDIHDTKAEKSLVCLPYPVAACEVVHGGVKGSFKREPVEVRHFYQTNSTDDLRSIFFNYGMFTAFSVHIDKNLPDFMMIKSIPMQWTEKRWVERHAENIDDRFLLLIADDADFETLYKVYNPEMLKKYEHLDNFGAMVCQNGRLFFLRNGYTWDPGVLNDYLHTLLELRHHI